MRDDDLHCPSCTCRPVESVRVDRHAPFFALVLEAEAAWRELMVVDRAAGRDTRHPFPSKRSRS